MIEAIDVNKKIEYSCPSDTSEPRTVFVLKPLSGIESMIVYGTGETGFTKQRIYDLLNMSIVEIRNFRDENVSTAIQMFPISVISDLIVKINELNVLSEQDKKK